MQIEFTVKVKDKHNPPEFKKGLGKGTIAKVTVEFDINEKEPTTIDAVAIINEKKRLLNDYFEVIAKPVKRK